MRLSIHTYFIMKKYLFTVQSIALLSDCFDSRVCIKKKPGGLLGLPGFDRGRLPTFPLSQYHRRGEV